MSKEWAANYRKLNADYWDAIGRLEKLRAGVAKFLSSPFMKGENGLVLTMNWADIEDLARAYDEACGYSVSAVGDADIAEEVQNETSQ